MQGDPDADSFDSFRFYETHSLCELSASFRTVFFDIEPAWQDSEALKTTQRLVRPAIRIFVRCNVLPSIVQHDCIDRVCKLTAGVRLESVQGIQDLRHFVVGAKRIPGAPCQPARR